MADTGSITATINKVIEESCEDVSIGDVSGEKTSSDDISAESATENIVLTFVRELIDSARWEW